LPKPDPALLDPARYPFHTEIEVRFGDLDPNHHVNNVSLAQYVEEGRVRFHRASGFHSALAGLGGRVASVGIEYLGEAFYPGTITISAAASQIGRTSYELVVLLRQAERTVVFARAVMVCVKDGAPFAIPESFRASVAEWMLRL
jgi:acyl-CoA thioester hydrolase